MASFTFVLLATSLLVATSSAAPQNTKFGITIPEACRGKGFCSIRPEGYDEIEAKINSLLPVNLINVDSRSGGGRNEEPPEDDDNCPSEISKESFYLYDDGPKTDIIVQTKLFPQEFSKVTCKYDKTHYKSLKEGGSQCFTKLELSDYHIVSTCEESYATRYLMVYDPEKEQLVKKNYTIPVCCSCFHRYNPPGETEVNSR